MLNLRKAALAAPIIAAAISAAATPARAAVEETSLALPALALIFAPIYIADEKGFWTKHELKVKLHDIVGIGSMNAVFAEQRRLLVELRPDRHPRPCPRPEGARHRRNAADAAVRGRAAQADRRPARDHRQVAGRQARAVAQGQEGDDDLAQHDRARLSALLAAPARRRPRARHHHRAHAARDGARRAQDRRRRRLQPGAAVDRDRRAAGARREAVEHHHRRPRRTSIRSRAT